MKRHLTAAAAVACALYGTGAVADDSSAGRFTDMFSVRGYGTIGVVHSTEDNADFVSSSFNQHEGAGASSSWSADVDSKLGVQISAQFTKRLSAILQVVSEDQTQNSWDDDTNPRFRPVVEWANLKYQITDELSLRAGRIVLPLQMHTDTRRIGYASHWVRPPNEVYGFMPYTGSDGVDATYRKQWGGAINTFNAHYGKQRASTEVEPLHPKTWGVNYTAQISNLMLRAAYVNMELDFQKFNLGAPFAAFEQIANGIPGGSAAAAADIRTSYFDVPTKLDHYSVGVSYDPGSWFVMAEGYFVRHPGFIGESDAGYVSGGIRWNNFTPFVTLSRLKVQDRSESIPTAGLPPQVAAFAGSLNALLDSFINVDTSQSTAAVGLRWDFMTNMDAKFQYQYIDLDEGSRGGYREGSYLAGFENGSNANVFSLAVDFVF